MRALHLLLFSIAGSAALAAHAAPSSLLNKSPFAPPAPPAAQAAAPVGRFELRGVVAIGGEPRFSIIDTSNSKVYWLRLNESEDGVRVSGYDTNNETATIEADGQKQDAKMKAPQISALALAPAPAPVPTSPVPNVAPTGAVAQPPSEQEIAERRQRIVEELRRRRALRAGGQGGQ